MPTDIESWEGLRDDQLSLYQWAKAISAGIVDLRLKNKKIGPLNASRWNPFATRLLRLYASYDKPTASLKNLALFVMKVYVPFWFHVKNDPLAINGSRHMFKYIQLVRQLPKSIQKPVQDSIQYNGFYSHSENILLGMITDQDKNIRQVGYEKILTARSKQSLKVRVFSIPLIQFQCDSYITMIKWDTALVTEPPLTQFLTNEILMELSESDDIIDIPSNMEMIYILFITSC